MADTLSHAFFYNSEDGDRIYDADSFEYLLKKFFTSGVFSGSCQVIADGAGMTCQMQAGYSNCDGKVRFFSEAVNLAIANAHATYDRIDTVVIERNDTDRDITCKVVTGTYSANPVAPAPVRSGGIYQLVVAEVYVAGGAVRITQSAITDKRPDTSVCGYVMCAVDTPDFSELYAQFTAQADEYIQVETADFEAWYQRMKDQLSEDAAGNLQEQIDDQQEQITALHAVATETSDGLMSASDKTNLEAISDVVDNTIAIVASGNVAPKAISAGQYVIWNKALYTARSAIAAGATLSTSNLAAVSNGGLNNLKASVDSLNSKITWRTLYAGGSTFKDDVGTEIPLNNADDCNLISLLLYDTALSAANRSYLLIAPVHGLLNAGYFPIAYGSTSDILRIQCSDNTLVILGRRNTTPLFIAGVYGKT